METSVNTSDMTAMTKPVLVYSANVVASCSRCGGGLTLDPDLVFREGGLNEAIRRAVVDHLRIDECRMTLLGKKSPACVLKARAKKPR